MSNFTMFVIAELEDGKTQVELITNGQREDWVIADTFDEALRRVTALRDYWVDPVPPYGQQFA